MRKLIAIACIIFFPVAPTQAQNGDQKIDQFIADEMARQKIPGLSLAIVREGRIVHVICRVVSTGIL